MSLFTKANRKGLTSFKLAKMIGELMEKQTPEADSRIIDCLEKLQKELLTRARRYRYAQDRHCIMFEAWRQVLRLPKKTVDNKLQ
jgi:hypothetical protein